MKTSSSKQRKRMHRSVSPTTIRIALVFLLICEGVWHTAVRRTARGDAFRALGESDA